MGVDAELRNFVQAAGVPIAAVTTPVSQARNPLDIIELLYGTFVDTDVTAAFGAGTRRVTHIQLVPTAAATAFIVVDQDGKIVGTTVTVAGSDYILPPIVRPIQSIPPIGGPATGVGGILRSFLNVRTTAVNLGGAAYNPATATIAFIGGLPPANTCQPGWRGCVNHLRVVKAGFGYPVGTTIVVMNGGQPSRTARATATFDGSGRLTDITILDMGARYTAVPQIGFVCPGGVGPVEPAEVGVSMAEGDPATATLGFAAGAINAVNMVTLGGGYVFPPTLLVDPGGPLGSGFVGTPSMGVERIDVIAGGTGYHDDPAADGAITVTPQFQEFFPTDVEQAKAFGKLQTPAIAQQSLSPVVPTPPIIT